MSSEALPGHPVFSMAAAREQLGVAQNTTYTEQFADEAQKNADGKRSASETAANILQVDPKFCFVIPYA